MAYVFADLVRNYTSTAGTDDFVLGGVVNGYVDFATALSIGNQFYYSVIGLDNPTEHEVGRGTLLAGGVVRRDPISGTKTNFTAGRKSIALVAAAEWFSALETDRVAGPLLSPNNLSDVASSSTSRTNLGVTGGFTAIVADRTALANLSTAHVAVYLKEAGREGVFLWSSSNLSTLVAADTAQGIYVAPASDTTGASGAWVRQFNGPAISTWFGVSTSGTAAANVTAFTAALATLKALALSGYGYNNTSIGLHTPAGRYQFSGSLSPDHSLEITGDCLGGEGGGTVFEWTANVHGFVTSGSDGISNNHSNGVKIKGFHLLGTNGGTAKHAISQNGFAEIEDIFAQNWSGDGIRATGTPPAGLSGSSWKNITGYTVGWALYIDGGDSNGCVSYNIGGSALRFGAIFDGSGIGCHHIGGVCNSAGGVSGYTTRCYNNGHIFMVAYGQEAGASANSPPSTATSNAYWLYLFDGSANAAQPQWTAAQTWYFSSPYCVDPTDNNTRSRFEGHYVETGLNAVILNTPSTIAGGQYLCPVLTNTGLRHGGYSIGNLGYLNFNNSILLNGPNASYFNNSNHFFGPQADPGVAQDYELQFNHWSSQSKITFYRSGIYGGQLVQTSNNIIADFDQWTFRTTSAGSNLVQINTSGLNVLTGAVLVNSATILNSSGVLQAAGFPALTGDVTTSAGSLATTINPTVQSKTAGYSETSTSGIQVRLCDLAAGFTVTLPAAVGNKAIFTFKKMQAAGAIIIDGNASETIDGGLTATLNNQYESISLISDGANWVII